MIEVVLCNCDQVWSACPLRMLQALEQQQQCACMCHKVLSQLDIRSHCW